ncbi:collagen alpha-1(I) chain-like [Plodia interpunctella]|uniref:collagen alpha-1(I) chain-like n=1 Tax=Plodia interpunctella TaxID=58824 RepID=UPI002367D3B8|nr:collagen alpha-1(I) chain-like [Plodia interpunctella]
MKSEAFWVFLALCARATADKWKFPEGSASVRVDTKVQFVDEGRPTSDRNTHQSDILEDESAPFQPAKDTSGFYNRPIDASGRYPVRVETHEPYRHLPAQPSYDGTVDSLLQCKCVSNPDCNSGHDSSNVCGPGKHLCCAKRPNKATYPSPEFFNEINDERPQLYPGRDDVAGPFPPPPGSVFNFEHEASGFRQQQPIIIGPGSTGNTGPPTKQVLVGPDGPTGIIGPAKTRQESPGVLVGPGGPTGVIGPPNKNDDRYIGPPRDVGSGESAQRGVLVGPGGPTGMIGPAGYGGRRPILVGPGGPTGIIGPFGYGTQMRNPGLLVGPGGPTGIIGPGRQILVGPGGPTGQIGPRRPFYYADRDYRRRCPRHRNKDKPREDHVGPSEGSARRRRPEKLE